MAFRHSERRRPHRWRSDPVFGRSDGMVWDRPEDVHAPAFRLRRREARGGCRLRLRKQPQYIDRVRIIGMNIPGIAYNADGLVPCIVQDADTLEVLMMAWMSEESLALTLERGETVFWSRSRRELWHKGATSCRSSWSCVTTAMPTRCSRSFIRRVRPAIPASAPASTARSPASRLSLGTLSAARPEDSAYVEPLHHRGCEDADRAS